MGHVYMTDWHTAKEKTEKGSSMINHSITKNSAKEEPLKYTLKHA